MRRLLKGLLRFIFAVVPLVVVTAGLAVLWMSRSLPPVAGTMNVEALSGPVTIARDDNGVPHVRGSTREDVFAGLGFAHAQDRLWQMEVSRMAGQGRLSEIFGAATLDTDVWLRTIAIYEAAEASYEAFPEEAKRGLQAYARGVNAWMEREARAFSSKLPPEFVILQHTPEPWRPQDSVAVVKMMSVGLAANIGEEVSRLAFARAGFTAEEIDDLLPMLPTVSPPPLPDLTALLGYGEAAPTQASLGMEPLSGDIRMAGLTGEGASNNWVVAGRRTDTGLPILANDPHLGLSAPSVWYLAHLRIEADGADGEARNLVGATLAGAPLVLLGRNDDVAWGFTNTGADVQDLFVERINPDDEAQYRTPEGWADFGAVEETIRVNGGDDHVFTRRFTRHGPVMPGSYSNLEELLPDGTVGALQWTALASDDTTMLSGLSLWDHRTVQDFQAGMGDFVTPIQSIVLADTEGNIGLLAPGRLPVRHPENAVMGRAPVPGWDATFDWQGTLAYEDLPSRLNPAVGAIGTANTKITPPTYPHLLTLDWNEPYRQRRVDELVVNAAGEHTMEASKAAQADIYSSGLADILPKMIEAVSQSEGVDGFVLAALGDWDFEMARDRPEPLIATAWLRHATIAIFEDDLGPAFERWFEARGKVMERVLDRATARNWCDRRETEAEEEGCGSVLAEALAAALTELETRHGSDRTTWRWGAAHVAKSEHRPFAEVSPLDRLFNVEVESGGDAFTLDRGRTRFGDDEPYVNRHAASYRAVYNLADLDASAYMTTTGQSGNVFSRHYRDLADRWAEVDYIAIPTGPETYERDAAGVWQIVP